MRENIIDMLQKKYKGVEIFKLDEGKCRVKIKEDSSYSFQNIKTYDIEGFLLERFGY